MPNWVSNPDPNIYWSDNYVVLDFETFGGEFGDAGSSESGIVLAAWLDGKECVEYREECSVGTGLQGRIRSRVGGEFDLNDLVDRIRAADFIVAHNAKFELRWLSRMGIDLRRVLPYCTQIGEYVLAGNRKYRLGLDATARRYGLQGKFQFASKCIKAGIDTREIPESALLNYCKNDVWLTWKIFLEQRRALYEGGLFPVTLARNMVTPALADIEFEGMQVDELKVQAEFERHSMAYRAASERLAGITGGINFRSAKQLREFIYDRLHFDELRDRRGNAIRTERGQPKTDKLTLEKLEAKTPEQREFLSAMRELNPLKKKMQVLETLLECCKVDKGRVYASFNQTVTQTHRLSSTGGRWKLQFHNFPRLFKKLFCARNDGFVICEADAPQLEFRVAVDLGGDQQGKRDILEGMDIHGFSSGVLGVSRQDAKAHTFKPLYGGQSGTVRERAYYDAFRDRYSEIYNTQKGWTYRVLQSKRLETATGLIFYWPDTEITRSGYIINTPSIFNYPIQMFATADIIPLTLVLVWHRIGHLRAKLVNTIHDSIVAEVHVDDLAEYKHILIDSFTNHIYFVLRKLYNYNFTTPLGVGIKSGTHWGEGEEEKYEGHNQDNLQQAVEREGPVLHVD